MLIGNIEYSRIIVKDDSGETIAEITDSVIEESEGYQIEMVMRCEVTE